VCRAAVGVGGAAEVAAAAAAVIGLGLSGFARRDPLLISLVTGVTGLQRVANRSTK
jgi:hypothetical protein